MTHLCLINFRNLALFAWYVPWLYGQRCYVRTNARVQLSEGWTGIVLAVVEETNVNICRLGTVGPGWAVCIGLYTHSRLITPTVACNYFAQHTMTRPFQLESTAWHHHQLLAVLTRSLSYIPLSCSSEPMTCVGIQEAWTNYDNDV